MPADEIISLFKQGLTPQEVIQTKGFSKSTVYRLWGQFKVVEGNVNKPVWIIENIRYNNKVGDPRYLPGENVSMGFSFRNLAERDFYLMNIGLQTEWMTSQNLWHSQRINDIVRRGQSRIFTFIFTVPADLPLGEYTLLFGVEGQYLPVQPHEQQIATTWSDPQIIHVKHKISSVKVFLSHNVSDEHLVRELEKHLVNYGLTVQSSDEFTYKPGQSIMQRTQQLIDSSDFFIALLTESAAQSGSVVQETAYAIGRNKPRILLREESVKVNSQHGWITFSRRESEDQIFNKIWAAVGHFRNNVVHSTADAGALGIALLAFLVGYGLSRGR